MDRIAREAGISRAALYLHFPDKETLFRALAAGLHETSLGGAAAAAAAGKTLEEKLAGVLVARSLRFFELLRSSEHADEFLSENNRLCGDLSAAAAVKYTKLLSRALADADGAGEISLADAGLRAQSAAELLLDTADGIKHRAHATMTTAEYEQRLRKAVGVLVAGLAGGKRRARSTATVRGAAKSARSA